MTDPRKEPRLATTPEEIAEVLRNCTPADFDGHTDFHKLTASQKLDWLAQAAVFVHEFKGLAQKPDSR